MCRNKTDDDLCVVGLGHSPPLWYLLLSLVIMEDDDDAVRVVQAFSLSYVWTASLTHNPHFMLTCQRAGCSQFSWVNLGDLIFKVGMRRLLTWRQHLRLAGREAESLLVSSSFDRVKTVWIRLRSLNNPKLMQPTRQKCPKIESGTQTPDSCFNPKTGKADYFCTVCFIYMMETPYFCEVTGTDWHKWVSSSISSSIKATNDEFDSRLKFK